MKILTPVIFIINKLANRICKLFGVDPNADTQKMTEEELRTIVDVSKESGVIESEEHTMINNVFDFGDAQAKEVMIPRIDMTFAQVDSSYDELIQIFQEDKFTRLPVYEDTTDNVIGILNMKDLLLCHDKDLFLFVILCVNRILHTSTRTLQNCLWKCVSPLSHLPLFWMSMVLLRV